MTEIKTGDLVTLSDYGKTNYCTIDADIPFPVRVVNIFTTDTKRVVQFLCPDASSRHGAMMIRSWNELAFQRVVKKRYRYVPVVSLMEGDIIFDKTTRKLDRVNLGHSYIIAEHRKMGWDAKWSGQTHVWKEINCD